MGSKPRPAAGVSAGAILRALDRAGDDFPALVTFSWRYGGARLHAFADERRWAIVIEEFTYGYNGHIDAFPLALHSFGENEGTRWLRPVECGPCGVLCFDLEQEDRSFHAQRLHPDATDVRIHGEVVPVSHDPRAYAALGIELRYAPAILKAEFHPYLLETYRDLIFATDEELGIELPRLLRLDAWQHPEMPPQRPSECSAIQAIAAVLEHREPQRYAAASAAADTNTRWNQRPD